MADLVNDVQSSTDYRTYISRKDWKYNISDLCALVDFDERFFRNLINLESDKKRKLYLRRRLRETINFRALLEDYLECLDFLSDKD